MGAELEIRRRIHERGRITFAEFMELALYLPKGGYYTNPGNVGTTGDFYTSSTAHPAFGALLCVQAFQMWQLLGRPSTFWVIEMGAGPGLLCRDLVEYSTHLPPSFHTSLRYVCLDSLASPALEGQLPFERGRKVYRLSAHGVPLRGIVGCFVSNELVDCFPVHRVTVEGGELKELYVTLDGDRLVEVVDSPLTPALEERFDSLGVRLPEGFNAEVALAIDPWMEEVASALDRGFMLSIDYGHPAKELYSSRRSRGTLTCYYKHTQTDNPYQRIGRQDITAQVDFTSLMQGGERHGLESLGFTTQQTFLQNLGIRQFIGRLAEPGLNQRDIEANRMGILDLVREGGIGDFKVLAQGKGVGRPQLWGFEPSPEAEAMIRELPVPLLTAHHVPLLEGRYPHLAQDWEHLWPSERQTPPGGP